MSLPIYEVGRYVATEAYKKDPNTILPLIEYAHTQPGLLATWHGLELQDQNNIYIINAWESIEHHQALVYDTDVFERVKEFMRAVITKPISGHHVQFPADIEKALDAPITELATFTLKDGVTADEYMPLNDRIIAKLYEELPGEIFPGSAAPTVENGEKYQVCLGWQSLERFERELPKAQGVLPLMMKARDMMNLDTRHARLTRYSKD